MKFSKWTKTILYTILCIYIIMMPLFPSTLQYKSIFINGDGVLPILIYFYIFMLMLNKTTRENFICGIKDFFTDYFTISLFILIIIMLFSVTYATDKNLALIETLRYVSYINLFFIIRAEFNDDKYRKKVISIYLIVSAIVGIVGLYQYFKGIGIIQSTEFGNILRVSSTIENSNNLGAYAVVSVYPFISLALSKCSILKRIMYILGSVIMISNVILSFSRNAMVVFVIGCLILTLYYGYKFFIGVVAVGLGASFIPQISHRLCEVTSSSQNLSRIKIWKTSFLMIKDHPILGVGNGNFKTLYMPYQKKSPDLHDSVLRFYPHDMFLKAQVEYGILGSISFLSVLVFAFLELKDYIDNIIKDNFIKAFYKGFFISLIAFYGLNIVDEFFTAPKVISCICILLAITESKKFRIKSSRK